MDQNAFLVKGRQILWLSLIDSNWMQLQSQHRLNSALCNGYNYEYERC